MSPPEDIAPLRKRFGRRLGFNGLITKEPDEPDDAAYRLLDRFLAEDVRLIKFWASPQAEGGSLFRDVPWRADVIRRASAAGVRVVMVHVADPDIWFRHRYKDRNRYGTKAEHYAGLERLIQEFPNMTWIAAHMGGDPENPDCLEELLGFYPNLYFDTSATKWQVREMSLRSRRMTRLICRYPDRFLFGSDLVTRPGLARDHYVSRYWCQRTLLESDWRGQSPIEDPDWRLEHGSASPALVGLNLPTEVLELVYRGNARRLLS
jgi:predicted TIM-barrel fold metal-dependent hydrolase